MPQVAICIVNLNCLEHTKKLISDLDRQTFLDYVVYLYDQNSSEHGTRYFLDQMRKRQNFVVKQNGANKPLNHIWNEFAKESHNAQYICFLNNDIRITSNYLDDTVNVLEKDGRIGIAIHASNNQAYSETMPATKHAIDAGKIKQGWEFTMRTNAWVDIPEILKFYCGDDFIFEMNSRNRGRVGVILSSPVIHKVSQTRAAMGKEFTESVREQALEDIKNYKELGYPHLWNNITKYSRLEQELKQITETSSASYNYYDYNARLSRHIEDVSNIKGIIIDVGTLDGQTFNTLLTAANDQNKKLIGVKYNHFEDDDIIYKSGYDIKSRQILNKLMKSNTSDYEIRGGDFVQEVNDISDKASFIFIGINDPLNLSKILPNLWELLEIGGSIFFPYYFYETSNSFKHEVDSFLEEHKGDILCSRMQTKPGIKDTYLTVKKFTHGVEYKKRDKPLAIACVLKSGGVYNETYVNRLASAVNRHLSSRVDYKFYCLTDCPLDKFNNVLIDEVIPLDYDLPGWWSKIELFRPELFNNQQVLYFDLDTLIVDNIDDFTDYGGDFMALRDFNTLLDMGSGVLSWNADLTKHIFVKFVKGMMAGKFGYNKFKGGDQEAIEHLLDLEPQWVQDVFPNKMAAFKYQCYNGEDGSVRIPDGYSVICFHSQPKMLDLKDDPIIKKHWK